jgi:hypothetical protein
VCVYENSPQQKAPTSGYDGPSRPVAESAYDSISVHCQWTTTSHSDGQRFEISPEARSSFIFPVRIWKLKSVDPEGDPEKDSDAYVQQEREGSNFEKATPVCSLRACVHFLPPFQRTTGAPFPHRRYGDASGHLLGRHALTLQTIDCWFVLHVNPPCKT